MTDKEKYRRLCDQQSDIPLFSRDWWLDAVCGPDQWDVVLVEKNDRILASMPVYRVKKFAFEGLAMPPLTQTLGPWLSYPSFKTENDKLEFEKKMFFQLIDKLPPCSYFYQHFHYSITNWLPFYWRGFKQSTRYTYIVEDLSDMAAVESSFSYAKRKNIKKAEQEVEVKFDLSAIDFYKNHQLTLGKQGRSIEYDFKLFERIYDACYQRNAGKSIYAVDKQGNIHSALFVIWYAESAYDFMSTIDPDFRASGSATLLTRDIMSYVSDKTRSFDFEGSMVEGVERSFRQFGTVQKPYFSISKAFNDVYRVLNTLRDLGAGA